MIDKIKKDIVSKYGMIYKFKINNIRNKSEYFIGKISEIMDNGKQNILRVEGLKNFLVPFMDEFIENVDVNSKVIVLKNIEGLV